jgi:hypothetical protein
MNDRLQSTSVSLHWPRRDGLSLPNDSCCRFFSAARDAEHRSPALGGEQADLMLHWRGK